MLPGLTGGLGQVSGEATTEDAMLALLLWTGCGPTGDLASEVARLEAENQTLQDDLGKAERERDAYKSRNQDLTQQLDAQRLRETYSRLGIEPEGSIGAILHTSMGDLNCELYPDTAPVTVLNFVELAEGAREWTDPRAGQKVERPLYDGTIFHRVIPGFMIQGGDPLGKGTGGPGYKFEDEVDNDRRFDRPGLLAMANSGPATNGSQFFVTEGTPDHLNGKHTIFGACKELDVVKEITRVDRNSRDKPDVDVVLKSVEIVRD
jgi:peptidyl-prolyl cis-trans isomerase A (cyclophilin A)